MGILIGEINVKYKENGLTVLTFLLETSELANNEENGDAPKEMHRIIMNNLAAPSIAKLQQGKLISIEGRIKTRSMLNENGHKVYITEIIANRFSVLGTTND